MEVKFYNRFQKSPFGWIRNKSQKIFDFFCQHPEYVKQFNQLKGEDYVGNSYNFNSDINFI